MKYRILHPFCKIKNINRQLKTQFTKISEVFMVFLKISLQQRECSDMFFKILYSLFFIQKFTIRFVA